MGIGQIGIDPVDTIVVVGLRKKDHAKLPSVRNIDTLLGFVQSALDGRHGQSRQQADDADDHQQLNQREGVCLEFTDLTEEGLHVSNFAQVEMAVK